LNRFRSVQGGWGTALHEACGKGHEAIVRFFAEAKLPLDLSDEVLPLAFRA
jgi:hypothetical protein